MRFVAIYRHCTVFSIALAIRSLDCTLQLQPVAPLGLWCRVAWRCYTPFAPLALSRAGKISIALAIHSLDPTELCEKETEF